MKKQLLTVAVLASSMLSFAQETEETESMGEVLKSKKGHEILPKQGDIALGFNAVPMIDFLLNSVRYISLFGGTPPTANNQAGNAIQYTTNSSNQIVGKYYLDAKTAVRARFGWNTLGGSITNQVQDAAALHAAQQGTQDDIDAAMLLRVDDVMRYAKRNIIVAGGIEKRRGYNRLQGFYGGELGIGNIAASEDVTYGNDFSDQHNTFYTTNFNSGAVGTQAWNTSSRVSRTMETKYRSVWSFGLRGFVGIEYFFLPKVSVAAEVGWGFKYSTQSGRTDKNEVYFNGQNGPEVVIEEVDSDSSSNTRGFSVDNSNLNSGNALNSTLNGNTSLSGGSGALTLLFHF